MSMAFETISKKEQSVSTSPSKGTALVTGASMGIGAVYADRLAKRGYDLILVARNEPRLRSLSARLSGETGRSVKVLRADLGDKAELARVEAILRDDPSITALVNNAGTGSVAPLLNADVEKMQDMIALNVTALTRLTYAAAPAFVARGAGTIINIASVVGISPETLNGVYGATKAFVLALSHSLQHELADKGIRIQVVLPGRPRPTSGKSPVCHGKNCRRRLSCRRKTWWMRRWSGSTRASWLRFPASMMQKNGLASRRSAAPSRSGSAIPCRRPVTALVYARGNGPNAGAREDR